MEYDFSGYATRTNILCTDGRTIMKDAFKDNDGERVPLVWQHLHDDPSAILGHADLENREDGVYAYCSFNNTPKAQEAKELVAHGDITALSIFANRLKERGKAVHKGSIKEVSLVLSGANKGAYIDNLVFAHGEDEFVSDEEAIIYGGTISHADEGGSGGPTVGDVIASMTEDQKKVMYAMIAAALEDAQGGEMAQSEDLDDDEEGEEELMHYNVFENDKKDDRVAKVLSHAEFSAIVEDAKKTGSFKEAFLAHAQEYGIENIELLFPDARNVTNPPDWIKRDTDWVPGVLNGVRHSPFSRIKSMAADITADEARAKGYVKGNLKKEEVFKLLKRVTTPTTIYKKQKLDRDDIIDITDMDVVAWIKSEMRMMLDEEIARAILVSDGRQPEDPDKINEENIRPIWKEDDMYAHHVMLTDGSDVEKTMEEILRAMENYEGSGNPALYTTQGFVTDMLLLKDKIGRRYFNTEAEVANALGVSRIVKVPVMKGLTRDDSGKKELVGIIINLRDYVVGADKGGNVAMFDDFDIDYNQYKYLMETRISGCLIHPKSALVIERTPTTGYSAVSSRPVSTKSDI